VNNLVIEITKIIISSLIMKTSEYRSKKVGDKKNYTSLFFLYLFQQLQKSLKKNFTLCLLLIISCEKVL